MSQGVPESSTLETGYMLVDGESLDARPTAASLPAADSGEWPEGPVDWGPGTMGHQITLRSVDTGRAGRSLHGAVRSVNEYLAQHGTCLLPGGMHPWMDPRRKAEPGEDADPRGRSPGDRDHTRANVQDVRVALPFEDDAGLSRLHAALRLVVPLLPALAAGTPFADGRFHGCLDFRLECLRHSGDRQAGPAGGIVPETERDIAARRSADAASGAHGDGAARGVSPRFDQGTIVLDVLDGQECATADAALAELASLLARALVEEAWSTLSEQQSVEQLLLEGVFMSTIREGEKAEIGGRAYLERLGILAADARGGRLWSALADQLASRYGLSTGTGRVLEHILRHGTLARRLLRSAGPAPDRTNLAAVYRRLADSLAEDRLFAG